MKEMLCFKSDDGFLFNTKEECIKYEKELKDKNNIKQFVEDHFYNGLTRNDLFDIIYENRIELKSIL